MVLAISIVGFFGCIVAGIFLLIKKPNKQEKVSKKITDILPIRYYEEDDFYILEEGEQCIDILQIKSKDLTSLSDDEIAYDIAKQTRFHKRYGEDLKLIVMNFPSDVSEQKRYFQKKEEQTKNQQRKKWLDVEMKRLQWIEKNQNTREFFMMFFGWNMEEILKYRDQIKRDLGTGKDGFIEVIEREKKDLILYRLNNKNAMVFRSKSYEKK